VGGQCHPPVALPPGKTRYALCRRLGGSQDLSGPVRKILSQPGCDPRTVQPLASRYTDYAISVQLSFLYQVKVSFLLVIYYNFFLSLDAFAKLRKVTVSFVMHWWSIHETVQSVTDCQSCINSSDRYLNANDLTAVCIIILQLRATITEFQLKFL
jgi:hypothetical protein